MLLRCVLSSASACIPGNVPAANPNLDKEVKYSFDDLVRRGQAARKGRLPLLLNPWPR